MAMTADITGTPGDANPNSSTVSPGDIEAAIEQIDGPVSFARAWLQRWTAAGGSVERNEPGSDRVLVGRPEYDYSPQATDDAKAMEAQAWPETMSAAARAGLLENRQVFHRAFYDGRMRELSDMLDDVPGAIDVVKKLVAIDPSLGRARKSENRA